MQNFMKVESASRNRMLKSIGPDFQVLYTFNSVTAALKRFIRTNQKTIGCIHSSFSYFCA